MRRYYILCLLLFLFFILVLNLKNVSYAYIWEDFTEFVSQTYSKDTSHIKNQINFLNANETTIKQKFLDVGDNVDNYDSFVLIGYNNRSINLWCIETNLNSEWYISGNYFYFKNLKYRSLTYYNGYSLSPIDTQGNYFSSIGFSANGQSLGITGLISKSPNNGQFGSMIGTNYYNYIVINRSTDLDTENLPWYFADAKVANNDYSNEITFELYDNNDNFILYLDSNNLGEENGGILFQLGIPYISWNNQSIISGNYYRVKFLEENNIIFTSEDFIITYTGPVPTPPPRNNYKSKWRYYWKYRLNRYNKFN